MTYREREQLITELTKLWYFTLVDHHKDSDCHFYIKMQWSYGQEPVYVVEHYGYILEETYEKFETYAQAQEYLISYLVEAKTNECEFYLTNPNNEEFVVQFQPKFLTIKQALNSITEKLRAS
jgi:hypothetical protein